MKNLYLQILNLFSEDSGSQRRLWRALDEEERCGRKTKETSSYLFV